MVVGEIQHISVDEKYAQGYDKRYGKDGFMMLIPAPQDLITGEPNQSAIATIPNVYVRKHWTKEKMLLFVNAPDRA